MVPSDLTKILAATLGACFFYGGLAEIKRPADPHPGLEDDELKEALRGDWDHQQLSYYKARKHLFSKVDGDGRKAEGRYTGEKIEYFSQPLPNTGNMEHAWSITRLPATARTDLHHTFPVIPEAKVARLNLHYGKVRVPVWERGGSRSGPGSKVKPVFEVRKEYRGDVARAMFYISTMYELDIPSAEEEILRDWHKQDSVDKAERKRNEKVQELQKSRNPFVDHPGLTKRISDF
jgi:hypothetical protein